MSEISPLEKKYVHVTDIKSTGLVEFDFSVGDPCMYVELALPKKQFDEFCKRHSVKHLTKEQEIEVQNDKYKWQYGVVGTLSVENSKQGEIKCQ